MESDKERMDVTETDMMEVIKTDSGFQDQIEEEEAKEDEPMGDQTVSGSKEQVEVVDENVSNKQDGEQSNSQVTSTPDFTDLSIDEGREKNSGNEESGVGVTDEEITGNGYEIEKGKETDVAEEANDGSNVKDLELEEVVSNKEDEGDCASVTDDKSSTHLEAERDEQIEIQSLTQDGENAKQEEEEEKESGKIDSQAGPEINERKPSSASERPAPLGSELQEGEKAQEDARSTHSAVSRGVISESKASVEEEQQVVVAEEPADAAQAPETRSVTASQGEPVETDDRGDQEEQSVGRSKTSLVKSVSRASEEHNEVSKDVDNTDSKSLDADTRSLKNDDGSKSQASWRVESPKRDQTSTPVQERKQTESAKKDSRPTTRERLGNRAKTIVVTPKRSADSPRRSQKSRWSETRSARRGSRERSPTRSPSRPRTNATSRSKDSDGRSRQKEFFKEELRRLEDSLKREKSKIVRPEPKKHTPYIFNTLQPYYDTSTVRYLLELPEEMEHQYVSRKTAIGLCDPWVDYNMDTNFLPRIISSSSRSINRQQEMDRRDQKLREREKRAKKEGSTMLPKFPVVTLDSKELANKQLYFSDVPMLREELRQKYSQNATKKIDDDYQRTKQDFYRMDLDKMDEYHPLSRPHMRSAYFAYLQNTPGSKKAVSECVKSVNEGKAH